MGASQGAALAYLLVQRLLDTVLQQPSQVLQWQTPALDSLAWYLAGADKPQASSATPASSPSPSSRCQSAAPTAAPQQAAAQAADLAISVAAAPLDASERSDAALASAGNQSSKAGSESGALSKADIVCAQLLGVLVAGKGSTSMLSDQAVKQVFSQIKSVLQRPAGMRVRCQRQDACYSVCC